MAPPLPAAAPAGTPVEIDFATRLNLVMKSLAISRGALATSLAVDKSLISRWLSGATRPGNHNLARLTAHIAASVPGFTMFDWESDPGALVARLGLGGDAIAALGPAGDFGTTDPGVVEDLVRPLKDLPDFARLPAFATSLHETASRAARYCGLWESFMPTVGRPDAFHCEHTLLWQHGVWLAGHALGVSYRWPLVGFIANGQLLLVFSDASDFVLRQFNRTDEPIIDQVDGLMLAAASLPHQAPTACRVIMRRLLGNDIARVDLEAAAAQRASDRRFLGPDDLPDAMATALLPDTGPAAAARGGDRLLRADPSMALVRTRWF